MLFLLIWQQRWNNNFKGKSKRVLSAIKWNKSENAKIKQDELLAFFKVLYALPCPHLACPVVVVAVTECDVWEPRAAVCLHPCLVCLSYNLLAPTTENKYKRKHLYRILHELSYNKIKYSYQLEDTGWSALVTSTRRHWLQGLVTSTRIHWLQGTRRIILVSGFGYRTSVKV